MGREGLALARQSILVVGSSWYQNAAQKAALSLLDLEFHMVVKHYMGAGIDPKSSVRAAALDS